MSNFNQGMFSYIFSVFAIFILITLISKISRSQEPKKEEFDERQEIVRSKGYKYAFYVLVYYTIFKIIWDILQETEGGPDIMDLAAVCLAIVVYSSYAILNDGYLPLNENPVLAILSLFALGAFYFTVGITDILSPDIQGSFDNLASLLVGSTALVRAIVMLAKWIYNKKRESEEPEE